MLDYTAFFRGSEKPPAADSELGLLFEVYSKNHILTLHGRKPLGFFDRLEKKMPQFRSEQVGLFRDGILFSTNDLNKDGTWSHHYKQADFNDIDYVQVTPNQFKLGLKSGETLYEFIN